MIYMHLPADNPCGEALAALEILGFSSWSCSEAHVTLSLQSLETNQLKHGFIWNCSRRFILWQFSKGKWLKWWWLTTTNFRVTQCSNKHQSQWAFCSPWTCLLLMHFGSRSQPPGFIHRNGAIYQAVPADRITRWTVGLSDVFNLLLLIALMCSSLSSNFW